MIVGFVYKDLHDLLQAKSYKIRYVNGLNIKYYVAVSAFKNIQGFIRFFSLKRDYFYVSDK